MLFRAGREQPAGPPTAAQLVFAGAEGRGTTQVTPFDQGPLQILQAAATGLPPGKPHVLALSTQPSGAAPLQVLVSSMANPAGAAIVNTVGPIRQVVQGDAGPVRRYLVIAPASAADPGMALQIQK